MWRKLDLVGHLESHFPAISEGNGSGFLIGPHHFLTAAHNLYRRDGKTEDDKWAFACTVTCGRNGQNYKPSDTLEAVSFYIPAKFLQGDAQDAANYDFALIVLRRVAVIAHELRPFVGREDFFPGQDLGRERLLKNRKVGDSSAHIGRTDTSSLHRAKEVVGRLAILSKTREWKRSNKEKERRSPHK